MNEATQTQTKRSPIEHIAAAIVDGRKVILIATLVLMAVSVFTRKWVHVENDLAEYLPDDSATRQALDLMDEQFTTFGTARVMVENITYTEAEAVADKLEALDGVQSVDFDSSSDHYRTAAALYDITFDYDEDDDACLTALGSVKAALASYDVYYSTSLGDTQAQALDSEISLITVYVAIIVVGVLIFTSETYAEVPVLLLTFVSAMVINSGSNFVFGTISFISNSVTSILQLALSLDYAIILSNHFKEEYQTQPLREAVISALGKAITEISASSLTTIGGLFAMIFMKFKVGPDMGICLIKSILFAMLSVFLVMPCLLMLFGPMMEKTRHKSFVPRVDFLGKFAYATRYVMPAVFVALALAGSVISQKCPYAYGEDGIETPKLNETQIAENAIDDAFGKQNMVALAVPAGSYESEKALLQELESRSEVDDVVGLANQELKDGYVLTDALTAREFADTMDIDYAAVCALYYAYADENSEYGRLLVDSTNYSVPAIDLISYAFDEANENKLDLDALDVEIEKDDGTTTTLSELNEDIDNAKAQLQSDSYSRMLVYLNLPESGDETYAFIDEMRAIAAKYYPSASVYMAGNSLNAYDFKLSFSSDNNTVSFMSLAIVFVVLLFTFYSFGMPVLLMLVIQGSIWINFSVPVLTDKPLFFLSYLIVSSIQMGANIDYAIVISNRYQELKNTMPHREAIIETMNFAFPTVLTSGSILATAGTLIGNMTSNAAIMGVGLSLGRGTIISMVLVLFALPQILLLGSDLVDKTMFSLPKHTRRKAAATGKIYVDGAVEGVVNGRISGRVKGVIDGDVNLTLRSGSAKGEEK